MLLRLSIALISAAVIGYEILLTRLLAIIHWHHFAYMIISLALLGFGMSGTFLTLCQRWILPRWSKAFIINAILFALLIPLSFLLAQKIPFNALEIAWNSQQLVNLFALYLLLTLPFFCAANCIGLVLARFKEQIHRLYRYDLLGAGLGALGIVIVLFFLAPTQCLRVLSALAFAGASLCVIERSKEGSKRTAVGLLCLACSIVLPLLWPSSWTQLRPSEYKGLSLSLNVPNTEVLHEYSSPLGLISVVKSPTIPFRHAPGLSLKNTQEPPPQLGVFTDGDSLTVITRYDGKPESLRYLDSLSSAAPYHIIPSPLKILILGAGGGADILLAKYHGAQKIDAVELNPQIMNLVQKTYRDFSGNIYGTEEVTTHIAEARGFVAKSQRHHQRYDLIQVSLLDSFSASSAGLYALSENYLYTKEAFRDYLSLLKPNGILAITRWLKIPPRDGLKLFATAVDTLKTMGISDPGTRLAMIRSWKTSTLLVKNSAFTEDEIRSLRRFTDERSFDVSYYPGMPPQEANRYNQLSSPYFHEGAIALLGTERDNFIDDYKFNIAPATDNSPYFFHFLKWRSLPEILSLKNKGGLPLLEWGYPILIGTLIQGALASLFFILLPLWWLKRQSLQHSGFGAVFLYFFSLGLAFLFIEIAYIQRFILFLSHPLYAVAVVLCAFLVFAGLGSGFSLRVAQRCGGLTARGRWKAIALAVCGITILSLLYHVLLPLIFHNFLAWPDNGRIAISLILIAPLAFCMGMPFPLGLALIGERQPDLIPWAWGINGCASVLSAVLATLLAIHFGLNTVIFLSLGLYLLAVFAMKRLSK